MRTYFRIIYQVRKTCDNFALKQIEQPSLSAMIIYYLKFGVAAKLKSHFLKNAVATKLASHLLFAE